MVYFAAVKDEVSAGAAVEPQKAAPGEAVGVFGWGKAETPGTLPGR